MMMTIMSVLMTMMMAIKENAHSSRSGWLMRITREFASPAPPTDKPKGMGMESKPVGRCGVCRDREDCLVKPVSLLARSRGRHAPRTQGAVEHR